MLLPFLLVLPLRRPAVAMHKQLSSSNDQLNDMPLCCMRSSGAPEPPLIAGLQYSGPSGSCNVTRRAKH
jgi:hypothetical protein